MVRVEQHEPGGFARQTGRMVGTVLPAIHYVVYEAGRAGLSRKTGRYRERHAGLFSHGRRHRKQFPESAFWTVRLFGKQARHERLDAIRQGRKRILGVSKFWPNLRNA